jgi:hypothetical protein
MTLAAMTQEARPARHPGALRGNGPANNDSAGPVAQAGPGSSLAGAYLNQFNEMVKLIERLPGTPELIGDLLIWQPTSYQDYFTASAMPGRASATDVYASLNRCVRQNFEDVVDDLEPLGALAAIRRHHKTHGESRPTSSPTFAPAPERIFAKCSARHTISSVMFQAGRAISRRAGSSGSRKLERKHFHRNAAPSLIRAGWRNAVATRATDRRWCNRAVWLEAVGAPLPLPYARVKTQVPPLRSS